MKKEIKNNYEAYQILDDLIKDENIILTCCYCNTFKIDDKWTGIGLPPKYKSYEKLSHGLCPPCAVNEYYDNIEDTL